ncbi:MAG: hypothetical protein Q8S13_00370, partial [Dehalococcoidia bacterium]|nr:hypothetical protein [Dehalococcoidia bacterium]
MARTAAARLPTASPLSVVAYMAGGGAELAPQLTDPGSSAFLRKVEATWSRGHVDEVLGYHAETSWKMLPEEPPGFTPSLPREDGKYRHGGYTSHATALALATQAWNEAALHNGNDVARPVGIGA